MYPSKDAGCGIARAGALVVALAGVDGPDPIFARSRIEELPMSGSKLRCPSCGHEGRHVTMTTVRSFVIEGRDLGSEFAHVCEQPECALVYFDDVALRIDVGEVRAAPFQKQRGESRVVCFCFGHSEAQLRAAETRGGNALVDAVTAACRAGLDRCETMNPQGRCCLGNVRSLLRRPVPTACCAGDE